MDLFSAATRLNLWFDGPLTTGCNTHLRSAYDLSFVFMTDTERRPLLAQGQNEEASAIVVVPSYTTPTETPNNAVEGATESANPTSEDSSGKPKVRMVTIVRDTSVALQVARWVPTAMRSSFPFLWGCFWQPWMALLWHRRMRPLEVILSSFRLPAGSQPGTCSR